MRVLVVDDSTIFRKVVRDALAEMPRVEVVGVAGDGKAALEKIDTLKPDLVTLDVEMPVMTGIELLRELRLRKQQPEVIMLSALTNQGALATTQALRLGAFDFVLKPAQSSLDQSCALLRQDLLPKVKALMERSPAPPASAASRQSVTSPKASEVSPQSASQDALKPASVVGIGVSTGGPAALSALIPKLPGDLSVPLLIVQHMPPVFTRSLADDLNKASQITVCEAAHGQVIEAGHAYIAPGGKQMKVGKLNGRHFIHLTDDPPERNCKPSVDYMFRSLAHTYGGEALALVMTGMGDDGTLGCRLLKRKGCTIVAQSEASCVVYGMPKQGCQCRAG